jgi:signal peptidase I
MAFRATLTSFLGTTSVILASSQFMGFVTVQGPSMQPALAAAEPHSDLVLYHCFTMPKRGDVVIACHPKSPSKLIAKRVIGLEGDVIWTGEPGVSQPTKCHWTSPVYSN